MQSFVVLKVCIVLIPGRWNCPRKINIIFFARLSRSRLRKPYDVYCVIYLLVIRHVEHVQIYLSAISLSWSQNIRQNENAYRAIDIVIYAIGIIIFTVQFKREWKHSAVTIRLDSSHCPEFLSVKCEVSPCRRRNRLRRKADANIVRLSEDQSDV